MTDGAQQALRRTMEVFSSTTRFALACNVSVKIIEPIQSRCAVLRFTRLSNEDVMERLVYVCEQESVQYTDEGLQAIIFTADGDMRQALNNLQSTHSGFGVVTDENVFKVCNQPHPIVVRQIVGACVRGDIDRAQESLESLTGDGYSASDIIGSFFKVIKDSDAVSEQLKLAFIREVGIVHMRIVAGLQTDVQLSGLLARLCAAANATRAEIAEQVVA
jgi:replication factor C subunit 2/4